MTYSLLAVASAAGLLASAACHLAGWLWIDPPWGKSVFALHVGIFAVWIPLVINANRTMPKGNGGNLDHLLAELPVWARIGVGVLFVYAIAHFLLFMWQAGRYPKTEVPLALQVRGFSGHWMMFYAAATAGFVGLGRLARKRRTGPGA